MNPDFVWVSVQFAHEGWMDWYCSKEQLAKLFRDGGYYIAIETGGTGYWYLPSTGSWVTYKVYPFESSPWDGYVDPEAEGHNGWG